MLPQTLGILNPRNSKTRKTRASARSCLKTFRTAPRVCKSDETGMAQNAARKLTEPSSIHRSWSRTVQSVFPLRRFASNYFAGTTAMRHPVGWSSRHMWQVATRTSKRSGRKGQRLSHGLALFHGHASYGSIQDMVAALFRLARMPNPSVNLTRNSTPRWPSEARYAHNAPLVQRVELSHAGYLKR
jgi:hypothetical protein